MKTAVKRILCVGLVLLMAFSCTAVAFAQFEPQTDSDEQAPYAITGVTLDGKKATVKLNNATAATLVVSVYAENGGQMLGTGVAQVEAYAGTAKVELNVTELPDSFVTKAFLLDSDNAPLCSNDTQIYTIGRDTDFDGDITQCKVGDIIQYGAYPQTRVTDSTTLRQLEPEAQARSWTPYPYYIEGEQTEFMYYLDVKLGTRRYRGVRFDRYRPYYTGGSERDSNQDDNGYSPGVVYWFRYEPLEWRVLDPATGLVLCETIIDSQDFHHTKESHANGKYANNWAESDIRTFLNTTFMNTAFRGDEQQAILSTDLDTPCPTDSSYSAGKTTDRVFLLSYYDVKNPAYGFADSADKCDAARRAKGSDYARCQGLYVFGNSYRGKAYWRLRSPDEDSDCNYYVSYEGEANTTYKTYFTSYGVRPALRLNPDAVTAQSKAGSVHSAGETGERRTVCAGQTYTASQSNTTPGEEYVLLVRAADADDLAADTLWYIDQKTADSAEIGFNYIPSYSGECAVEIIGRRAAPVEPEPSIRLTGVTMDGKKATVKLNNATAATLVVSVYAENGGQMLGSGVAQVEANVGTAEVELNVTELPDYFVTKAFLLDSDNAPLCNNDTQIHAISRDTDFDGDITLCKVGDIIQYGAYPQSRETDNDTLLRLEAAAKSKDWTAYPYYIEGEQTEYMYYFDVKLGTQLYRGVRFDRYRPSWTDVSSSEEKSDQDDNGYSPGVVYWFRYEPLEWRVLEPATGLVLCETIIDSQNFHHTDANHANGKYANNWGESDIRTFLNTTFLYTAFNRTERQTILFTDLDTPCPWNADSDAGKSTDRVFLLSYYDVLNPAYGFADSSLTFDVARRAQGSDYAECQGLYVPGRDSYSGNACWGLRSPEPVPSYVFCVNEKGYSDTGYDTDSTYGGVRPALRLNLGSVDERSETRSVQSAGETGERRTVCAGQTYTASQSNIIPGAEYVLLVRAADADTLTADTLWYIDQKTADSADVGFDYVPSHSGECTVEIIGRRSRLTGVTCSGGTLVYKKSMTLAPTVQTDGDVQYTLTYASSNPKIAEVDRDGNITTRKSGTVTVTVTATNNADPTDTVETTCTVTVKYAWWQWLIRMLLLGFIWY